MPEPQVRVLGVYRVPVDDALVRQAMDIKYLHLPLGATARRDAEQRVSEELRRVVLVEVEVANADTNYDAGDFGQPGSDQAAYNEKYLDPSGTRVISEGTNSPLLPGDLRVAFFIHEFDPRQPIISSYGAFATPAISEMPARLHAIIQYEPVD